MSVRRRLQSAVVAVAAALTVVGLILSASAALAVGPTVNGAGSSFARLEIDQWRAEVAREPFDLSVNYTALGSTYGRSEYISGRTDFAVSDIPFTAPELTVLNREQFRSKDFAYVPISAGALGFMYNLVDVAGQRVTNLNLTRRAVCRIFTEPGMRWNDPEIQAANPTVSVPDQLVRPIVRTDGAGTSYALSEYCLTVEPATWAAFIELVRDNSETHPDVVAGLPTSYWPRFGVSRSAPGADGVAAAVAAPAGLFSIAYNEAGYTTLYGFRNANVQNAAGQFTQPTQTAVTTALGYASARPDGTFALEYDGVDPAAYFPAIYSFAVAQTTGFPEDKGLVLAKFLCYAVTKGQRPQLTSALGYVSLSSSLVEIAKNAIAGIPGAPPWDQCAVGDIVPPPVVPEAPFAVLPVLTTAVLAGAYFAITRSKKHRSVPAR